ncbi:hypothetical protein [Amycolatopsis sp. YIM 10]|uniref:hypothetical protein n=1 Tax=Amycolatopsis sp. YIM 10 TaxID=2653857 RepID=UPI0012904B00|nr:hypothetical protein [Amycolatopsis sp. YIM 10]QFU87884.1 hypothetical protein YIM_13490 [Amycolatopsis sp. YIM 10]QFU94803.1 hypothetical protein YIM_48390 [Amycolatopsis sp. YIM 10]
MSIAATYLGDLGRVRVQLAGAPAVADHAIVERSTDTITWTTVRAGLTVGLSGGAGVVDDYEYIPGVVNHYRASYVDNAQISYSNGDGPVHADNAAVTPTIAAGLQVDGMLLTLVVACRSTAQTVDTPAGWIKIIDYQTVKVFHKRWTAGTVNPTITPAGGAAGDTVTAYIVGFSNAEPGYTALATQTNASGQNIPTPSLTVPDPNSAIALVAHKLAEVTTTSVLSLFLNSAVNSTAVGLDQAAIWQRASAASNISSVAAQTLTITGGAAAISRAVIWSMRKAPWISQESTSITPVNTQFWIKNLRRPNNNVQVNVTGFGDIGRTARTGVFDVINRTLPVAVTDLHSGRSMELRVTTDTVGAAADLDTRFAAGEVMLFQSLGPDCPIPTMYAVIGNYAYGRKSQRAQRRHFTLPLVEVAAPDAGVFSTTVTYGDLPGLFATYADLIAAEPTYSDVLDIVAESEVIVP